MTFRTDVLDARPTSFGGARQVRRALSHAGSVSATRVLDIVLSLALIVFVAPLVLLICGIVKLYDGGPVLFAQERKGLGGRRFRCLKFRTMAMDAERQLTTLLASCPTSRAEWARDHKLKSDPRITPMGAFLRRSSLDELPQLLNILKGDMSLVGPRPIVEGEVGRYGRWYRHYCSVKPGLTGLWQVSGRNNVSYRRRVALDVLYARRRSLLLYFRILLVTIPSVLQRDGAY
jgi:exopolysaccharide production protein ExoY